MPPRNTFTHEHHLSSSTLPSTPPSTPPSIPGPSLTHLGRPEQLVCRKQPGVAVQGADQQDLQRTVAADPEAVGQTFQCAALCPSRKKSNTNTVSKAASMQPPTRPPPHIPSPPTALPAACTLRRRPSTCECRCCCSHCRLRRPCYCRCLAAGCARTAASSAPGGRTRAPLRGACSPMICHVMSFGVAMSFCCLVCQGHVVPLHCSLLSACTGRVLLLPAVLLAQTQPPTHLRIS